MSDHIAERIHPASPQRRQLARQDGRVARSHDLVVAAVMLGGSLVLLAIGGELVTFFTGFARQQLGGEDTRRSARLRRLAMLLSGQIVEEAWL